MDGHPFDSSKQSLSVGYSASAYLTQLLTRGPHWYETLFGEEPKIICPRPCYPKHNVSQFSYDFTQKDSVNKMMNSVEDNYANILVSCSPGNPSGRKLGKEQWRQLSIKVEKENKIRKYVGEAPLMVVVDEAYLYVDLTDDRPCSSLHYMEFYRALELIS